MQKSWKVLIADDEPIIREGIIDAVDWQTLHMEVVGEAEDGEEALELAVTHEIDILLVDLSMPIMNGITLIKQLRERQYECKIVIITGHDEFIYAQEAIRLDVKDYILKPANPEQLQNVLSKIRSELDASVKQKEHLLMASKQIEKNIPLLRERFCLEWMEGNLTIEEIVEQLQFLQLPSRCPDFIGVVRWTEFYANQPIMKENERQLTMFAIENIISELLESYQHVMFRDPSGLIVVCIWGSLQDHIIFEIEKNVQAYLKISLTLHFEALKENLLDIQRIYRYCKTKVFDESQISPIVRRAKNYIFDHFSEMGLTLESMAQSLLVSPVYLSRIIKQELGMTFVSLLTYTRIQEAIQLLHTTDLSINEIAEKVGYDTQHYFSTAFKKVVGVSPNQYRKGAEGIPNHYKI